MSIKGAMIAASVAGLFTMGVAGMASAKKGDDVLCSGVNACKGQSACKGGDNACKGNRDSRIFFRRSPINMHSPRPRSAGANPSSFLKRVANGA